MTRLLMFLCLMLTLMLMFFSMIGGAPELGMFFNQRNTALYSLYAALLGGGFYIIGYNHNYANVAEDTV